MQQPANVPIAPNTTTPLLNPMSLFRITSPPSATIAARRVDRRSESIDERTSDDQRELSQWRRWITDKSGQTACSARLDEAAEPGLARFHECSMLGFSIWFAE